MLQPQPWLGAGGGRQSFIDSAFVRDWYATAVGQGHLFFDKIFLAYASAIAAGPRVLKLVSMDACFGKDRARDVHFFHIVGLSSNFNIIPLASAIMLENETKESWAEFINFAKEQYPFLNQPGNSMTAIVDADKGMGPAMQQNLEHVKRFLCSHHRVQNVTKYATVVGKEVYTAALQARTQEQLTDAKLALEDMPGRARAYWRARQTRLSSQCPAWTTGAFCTGGPLRSSRSPSTSAR